MINLKNIKNQKFSEIKLVELLFYTFPVSFIIGNLVLSLNLFLFIVFSLILIKKKELSYRFKNVYWLLIAFFLYVFLITAAKFESLELLYATAPNWSTENHPILKSFILVRFIILIFLVDTLFFNKILNLKKFFFISLICTSFVSFDVILQYIVGFDLFGFKTLGARNSGPFGDEVIAGSYLQKFSFMSFFYIFEIVKNKNYNRSLLIFIITLHATAILLAGNRMPMLLFLFGLVIIIIFLKEMRFITISSLIFFTTIFIFISTNDKNFGQRYIDQILLNFQIKKVTQNYEEKSLTNEKKDLKNYKIEKESDFLRNSRHGRIFRASIAMWKEEPIFGFGLKSFRIKCWEILPKIKFLACATHSHNYYLELLSETGIIGTSLIVIFFIILMKNYFGHLMNYNKIIAPEKYLLVPIILIFFLEIWPLRSSGSFFTTWNATLFWLNIAILLAINEKKVN